MKRLSRIVDEALVKRLAYSSRLFSACSVNGVITKVAFILGLALIDSSLAISSDSINGKTTVEEDRLQVLKSAELEFSKQLDLLSKTLAPKIKRLETEDGLRQFARSEGHRLWQNAQETDKREAVIDDRPLYWKRLVAAQMIRGHARDLRLELGEIKRLLASFEWASRGQGDIVWTVSGARRILITGFDPFSLDQHIGQSNPSGAAALTLDGRVFEVDDGLVEINAAIFPVRYTDFDAGIFEQWLGPHLTNGSIDLFVTISMGRDQFDLERFPGRRRSSSALGNLREHTGGTATTPKPGLLDGRPLQGPEFVEFSLPVVQMLRAEGDYKIRDNHKVTTFEKGTFEATSLASLRNQTAVQGSGGGYLSNEISYRSIRLANELGVMLPMGHIHTPSIQGQAPKEVASIVAQVRNMLLLAVSPQP